jgi:hypothetical protein
MECLGRAPCQQTARILESVLSLESSAATLIALIRGTSTHRTGDLSSKRGCRSRKCSICHHLVLHMVAQARPHIPRPWHLHMDSRRPIQQYPIWCQHRHMHSIPHPRYGLAKNLCVVSCTNYTQYVPQAPQQQYPAAASPMPAYPSQMPSGTPPQSWQGSYSPSSAYAARGPTQGGVPYAFGQLPANANPNDPKSQHPIPGSYNRNHGFNPKTQSFIPGGSMPPAHPPQPPFTAPGSHHSSPQIGTPHLAYTGYQSPMPPPSYGSGYSMARQGSNTSLPAFHGPQQHPPPHPFPGAPMQGPPPHPPAPSNSRPHGQHGQSNQTYGHLPAYGNPASLPQKPATGI